MGLTRTFEDLYPFQKEDVEKMRSMKHVLLFSDMGTGKTVVSLSHLVEKNLVPALVLCPTSLKDNWFEEVQIWTPFDAVYANTADEVVSDLFSEKNPNTVYILHHEALAYTSGDPIREMLGKIPWKAVIIDECHRFRNDATERTKTLLSFSESKFMCLSGTPVVNSAADLFPILKLVGIENNHSAFMSKYVVGRQTQFGFKITGSKREDALLESMSEYYIRRKKEDVLKELPDKIVQRINLEMEPCQRQVYDTYEEKLCLLMESGESLSSPNVLSAMTRLRQLNLDPGIFDIKAKSSKTRAVKELIEQSPNEKWVVVSTFKQYLQRLYDANPDSSILFTGDDAPSDRHMKIKNFKDNPNRKILLGTMQTLGLGINLQFCSKMIITDPWWNQPAIEQAMDRIYRIGQENKVFIYELDNTRSIDEDIREIIKKKSDIADKLVVNEEVMKGIFNRRRGFPCS